MKKSVELNESTPSSTDDARGRRLVQNVADAALDCGEEPQPKCCHCDEAVEENPWEAFIVYGPCDDYGHPDRTARLPVHHECRFRMTMGSLAHLQGRCSCFAAGAKEGDPPNITTRQAARAAYDYWQMLTTSQREATICRAALAKARGESDAAPETNPR